MSHRKLRGSKLQIILSSESFYFCSHHLQYMFFLYLQILGVILKLAKNILAVFFTQNDKTNKHPYGLFPQLNNRNAYGNLSGHQAGTIQGK